MSKEIEEAKHIITTVFKRSGREALSSSEFPLILSMELRWFPPSQARRFTKWCIENNLLETREREKLTPTFNIKGCNPPIDFKPTIKQWNTEKTLLERIIEYISRNTDEDIETSIEKITSEKQIIPEVAAILTGLKLGIDMYRFLDEVERKLYTSLGEEIKSDREKKNTHTMTTSNTP